MKTKKILKKIRSMALAVLIAIGTLTAGVRTGTYAVNASFSDGESDYSKLYDAAAAHVDAPYNSGQRTGPGYDCSGLVDVAAAEAGIDSTMLNNRWVTSTWCNYLDNLSSVTKIDTTQDQIPYKSVSKGDIVMFYEYSSRSASSSYHMGVILNSNKFVSAIYSGVKVRSFVYDSSDGVYAYSAGGDKSESGTYVRIYHFQQTPKERPVEINVLKSNANPSITEGNSQYSLAGAEYTIYSDAACTSAVKTITTGADGKASSGTFRISWTATTLYVKETKASAGFCIDPNVYTVDFGSSSRNTVTRTVNSSEVPGNDPLVITLTKVSEDGSTVENVPSLEGAQFTVRFYDSQYTSVEDIKAANAVPSRTWVIETKYNEASGKYAARLADAYKVNGDEFFYTAAGSVVLPLGTVTVEETLAPDKYTLKNAVINKIDGSTVTQTDGIALFNIVGNNGNFQVRGGNEYTISETAVRTGSVRIQKKDAEAGTSVQGDAADLTAVIRIENLNDYDVVARDDSGAVIGTASANGTLSYKITTGRDGSWESSKNFLPYGSYKFVEESAPLGYTLNGSTEVTVNVTEDSQEIDLTNSFNDFVIRGGFEVRKYDVDAGARAQGDTDLQISFAVYNRSEHAVMVNGQMYEPDTIVFTETTDKTGYYKSAEDLLPYGTYELIETVAPLHYTTEGTTSSVFTIRNDGEIANLIGKISNRVSYGKFSIAKTLETERNGDISSVPEEGAEFTAVLKTYVEQYGSVESAMEHRADFTEHEYAVITTDSKGFAESGDLAYGTYVIAQTGTANPEISLMDGTIEFAVTEDGQETVNYDVVNVPLTYHLRIVKKDADTGEYSALNSADFRILQLTDVNGNEVNEYVTQTIGDVTYSTFRTSSANGTVEEGVFYAADGVLGTSELPLALEAGSYQLEETDAPDRFTVLGEPIRFAIEAGMVTAEENGMHVIEVTAEDKQITGTVKIEKQIEKFSADTSFIDRMDLSGIEFTLSAAEDIIAADTGRVLARKGEPAVNIHGEEVGVFHVDREGKAELTKLPLGSYVLKETSVPDGIIMDTEERSIVLAQDEGNEIKAVYTVSEQIENRTTKLEVSKTDLTGEDELEGALLQVIDSEGEVVDEWISGRKPHIIEGLKRNEEYTLHEEGAPDGVYYAEDAKFTLTDGELMHIEMTDNVIRYRIAKVDDVDGSYVAGVTLKLTDITDAENPAEVELPNKGITTDQPFDLDRKLIAGHSYILEESEYVAGVYAATSIEFTVPKYGTADVTTITMVDAVTAVSVAKVDNHGNYVPGAVLQVLETAEDELGNIISGDLVYEFMSEDAASDVSKYVKGGETYILREYETPFGFNTFEDIVFTVTGTNEEHQVIMAVDTRKTYYVSVVKADAQDSKKLLKGAEITLFNADGTIAKDINGKDCIGLTDGKGVITWQVEYNDDLFDEEYGLYAQETKAPQGYRINRNKFPVQLSESYDFAAENPVVILVNDTALPATGVYAPVAAGIAGLISLIGLVFIRFRRNRKA